ncbi:cytochrome P450 monooxygenase-like protein [Hypoxylon cercidicola]|nr:cytochrome P450 monooxygenase-like protein [Hypoxylon cercidicola]
MAGPYFFNSMSSTDWVIVLTTLGPLLLIANGIYNLFFHPLAHVPGPFFARASGIPAWYHTYRGKRHIWLWEQFQIYGNKIRSEPNTVLFCDPEAYADIYSMKSNMRRSHFYTLWRRDEGDQTAFNSVDVAAHARMRKLLNQSFTEKSLGAASNFVIKHVDRWNQLFVNDNGNDINMDWSAPVDFALKADTLALDVIGDLSLGKSFNLKEPGENPLEAVPHNIHEFMVFYNNMARSPILNLVLWLKPHGLDRLLALLTPPAVQKYLQFLHESVTERITLQEEQAEKPEGERRQDMFYFLYEARDPNTGLPGYDENSLRSETNSFLIAGSDTVAVALSSTFFYLTGDPRRCQKLTREIRTTFASADEIVLGPKLSSCTYLKACIDEGMRLSPPVPSDLQREVLPGGLTIKGEFFPAGTNVGTSNWADTHSLEIYGDPDVFRPERWIVDESAGVTKEDVARMRSMLHPFSSGPHRCPGKNLAMVELLIAVARTLYRLDVRREPESTVGGGAPEFGWGSRSPKQYDIRDAFVSIRRGPMVQFKKAVSDL